MMHSMMRWSIEDELNRPRKLLNQPRVNPKLIKSIYLIME